MEAHDISDAIAILLIGVVSYFLKGVMSDAKELEEKNNTQSEQILLLRYRLDLAEKKLDKHHSRLGAMQVSGTSFDALGSKLDEIIKHLKDEHNRKDTNN